MQVLCYWLSTVRELNYSLLQIFEKGKLIFNELQIFGFWSPWIISSTIVNTKLGYNTHSYNPVLTYDWVSSQSRVYYYLAFVCVHSNCMSVFALWPVVVSIDLIRCSFMLTMEHERLEMFMKKHCVWAYQRIIWALKMWVGEE